MKIKLEITVEVEDNFLESMDEEDLLNFCCNILEINFEKHYPVSDTKKIVWEESKVNKEDSLKELRDYWENEKNWEDYYYGLEGLRNIVEKIM